MENNNEKKQTVVCLLKDCITDPKLIEKYLSEHQELRDKSKADYVLVASVTHLLYKYETDTGVWYVHYGPIEIFKICVYSKDI